MESAFPSGDADVYLASIEDEVIHCTTVQDAIAVRFAHRVLHDGELATPVQLQHVAKVLLSYNCHDAAASIANRLTRLRAADYLKNSVDYVRPNNKGPK